MKKLILLIATVLVLGCALLYSASQVRAQPYFVDHVTDSRSYRGYSYEAIIEAVRVVLKEEGFIVDRYYHTTGSLHAIKEDSKTEIWVGVGPLRDYYYTNINVTKDGRQVRDVTYYKKFFSKLDKALKIRSIGKQRR